METSQPKQESMVILEIPDNPELLVAVGKVALRNSLLDLVMRMTIKVITGVSVADALRATARTSSRDLRERVRKLAKNTLGDGPAFLELEALLHQAEDVAYDRNKVIHSDWVLDEGGNPKVQDPLKGLVEVPSVKELENLADRIKHIYILLNTSRLDGSLKKALDSKVKSR